ncbi:MAG: holo-ACP synthase [Ktedonobacterales bacterium]|nr:holo-ACP synthase [Ktedonobacterales bacterium]
MNPALATPRDHLDQHLDQHLRQMLTRCRARAIVGIGVDIEDVSSFATLPYAAHQPFYARLFTAAEVAYCLGCAAPAEHFAARFAAKEAVVKACGGLAALTPAHVEIIRQPAGAPLVRLSAEVMPPLPLEMLVSLGHTADCGYAVAVALAACG